MSGFVLGGPLGPYFELFLIFITNTQLSPFFLCLSNVTFVSPNRFGRIVLKKINFYKKNLNHFF